MSAYSMASIPMSDHCRFSARAFPRTQRQKVCSSQRLLSMSSTSLLRITRSSRHFKSLSYGYAASFFMPDLLWSLVLDLSTQNLSRDASGSLSCPPLAHQGARA
jgi:hypothetical protein